MKAKIVLIYIDSGGGHRAAAEALHTVIRGQGRPWDVRMVSIQDLLNEIDFIRKYSGIPFQDVYNIMLRRGWTAGMEHIIPVMHLVIRLFHDSQVEVLERQWGQMAPDLVVSMIPHYNRALKESLGRAFPGTPFVTLLTDIADYPPHFWIEPMDQHVICGSERAALQAAEIGMAPERILRTSGMILHPRFYAPPGLDRGAERVKRGLDPERPTGLVLFGGEGSVEMPSIARALNCHETQVQLILLCGRNDAVAQELRALEKRIPMFVEGFTRDVPAYMEISDFFIGKPGPGCISEALAKRLPVIVQQNAWTMAHERYNAEWVQEQGVGIAVKSFDREIRGAVERLLAPHNYERFRERAAGMRNRAVYEIPELLDGILRAQGCAASSGTRLACEISPR
jgi:1,2-diacylglycerol 3-beta-galactosyltransferase